MIHWLHSHVEISFLTNIVTEWHETDHVTFLNSSLSLPDPYRFVCNVKDQRSTPGFITYANIKILDGLFRHLESKPHTIEGGRRRRISGSRAALSTSVSVNNVQTFLGNSKQIFIHVRRLVIGGSMILSDPK